VTTRANQAIPDSQLDVFAELVDANESLRRSNADLRRTQLAVTQGLDALDEWTEGRLRELVEHACDELADLVDLILDGREELL
jgi:hypothetical protein